MPVGKQGAGWRGTVRFAGGKLCRLLDDWRTPEGRRFAFPFHDGATDLALETEFRADPAIRSLLAAARPRNLAGFEPLLPEWRRKYPDNFAWARPDRLWLVLPFTDADRAQGIALKVNGKDVPVDCHAIGRRIIYFADLTDHVLWGQDVALRLHLKGLAANQFLGPYLDYPPAPPVGQLAGPEATPKRAPEVIYDRPVDPSMPPRVPSGAEPKQRVPAVTWVTMSPAFLREGQTTVFSAKVDLPPEELESVTISAPGGDAPMGFDAKSGNWVFAHRPGGRAGLIMDVPSYHVWAVAKNGMVSPAREIPPQWRFK